MDDSSTVFVVILIVVVALLLWCWFSSGSSTVSNGGVGGVQKRADGTRCTSDDQCEHGICGTSESALGRVCLTPLGDECNTENSTCVGNGGCGHKTYDTSSEIVCCPSGGSFIDGCNFRRFCTESADTGDYCRHNAQCKSGKCTNSGCQIGRCT